MFKRISKELKILEEKYGEIRHLNNMENVMEPDGFQIVLKHKNIEFKIVFNKDHPFRPCHLYILRHGNEIEYTTALKKAYMKYIHYSNKLYGPPRVIQCPCCYNIFCQWHVSHMSYMMIDECCHHLECYQNIQECYYGKLALKSI